MGNKIEGLSVAMRGVICGGLPRAQKKSVRQGSRAVRSQKHEAPMVSRHPGRSFRSTNLFFRELAVKRGEADPEQ